MQPLVSDPRVESGTNPFRFQMAHLINEGGWARLTPLSTLFFYLIFCPTFIHISLLLFTLRSSILPFPHYFLQCSKYLLIGIGFSPCTIYRVWILPVEILDWSYCVILCESSNNKSKKYNLSKWRNIICLVDNMSGTRL